MSGTNYRFFVFLLNGNKEDKEETEGDLDIWDVVNTFNVDL